MSSTEDVYQASELVDANVDVNLETMRIPLSIYYSVLEYIYCSVMEQASLARLPRTSKGTFKREPFIQRQWSCRISFTLLLLTDFEHLRHVCLLIIEYIFGL
jgi:hypothetical protein